MLLRNTCVFIGWNMKRKQSGVALMPNQDIIRAHGKSRSGQASKGTKLRHPLFGYATHPKTTPRLLMAFLLADVVSYAYHGTLYGSL